MRRLRKFLGLSLGEKLLLIKAAVLVLAIRVALSLLPFSTLQKLVGKTKKKHVNQGRKERLSIEQLAWSVGAVSQCVPKATCLVQALVTQVLLLREGLPATLRIGVAKEGKGELQAHAWVESEGRVIIGETKIVEYTPLIERHG